MAALPSLTGIVQFDLSDAVAVPRTITPGYRFAPAVPTTEPPADQCTREQRLDLAQGAARHPEQLWRLLGSSAHVRAICEDYAEHMALEIHDAQATIVELSNEHALAIRTLQNQLATQQGLGLEYQARFERSDRALAATTAELYEERRKVEREREAHNETIARLTAEMRHSLKLSEQAQSLSNINATMSHAMASITAQLHDARGKESK